MPKLCRIAEQLKVKYASGTAVNLSSYKGGGEIEYLFIPESENEFCAIYSALKNENYNPYILGGGSNTLIADGVNEIPVISTARLNNVCLSSDHIDQITESLTDSVDPECRDVIVSAQAGVRTGALLSFLKANGTGGLEFLTGIPASVGGIIRMNAGAFGHETADHLYKLTLLNPESGEIYEKQTNASEYSYRSGEKAIVLNALFLLKRQPIEITERNCANYLSQRRYKQPGAPSLGSVFENPRNSYPAAVMLDKAGLKGRRFGGAEISEKHANFIINKGGGTAADYLALVKEAQTRVFEIFGVNLKREFVLLGGEI